VLQTNQKYEESLGRLNETQSQLQTIESQLGIVTSEVGSHELFCVFPETEQSVRVASFP